jgi:hypothetical protein
MHLVRQFLCAEKANRRVKKHATAYESAPLRPRRNRQPSLWHGGLDPRVILLGRRYLRTEKSHRRSRQYHASPGPPQKTEKINFQIQCSDSRHPAHGPKPLSVEVIGQSAAGTGMAVGVSKGGPAVITPTGTQKQRANRQSNFGPTCRLVSSPEAGPGATIGTLNQGYPLLQYEGTVPVRRSLAAR